MTPTLKKKLAELAPSIAIEFIWCKDPDEKWDSLNFINLDPDDFDVWMVEVRATAIVYGDKISGSDYLGGCWEPFGEHPSKSNPDISGYDLQKIEEALRELAKQPGTGGLSDEIYGAIAFLKDEMKQRHERQMNDSRTKS